MTNIQAVAIQTGLIDRAIHFLFQVAIYLGSPIQQRTAVCINNNLFEMHPGIIGTVFNQTFIRQMRSVTCFCRDINFQCGFGMDHRRIRGWG